MIKISGKSENSLKSDLHTTKKHLIFAPENISITL